MVLLRNVAEGLFAYDANNATIPCLAERWEVSADGLTYTFHIRPNVKFSNGRALVADDFRWTWERNLAPSFGSAYAPTYLAGIRGVKEYVAGKAKSISGVKVLDPATLQITLERPCPYFLGFLTTVPSFVLAREAAGDKPATQPEMVVGTGAFRMTRVLPDQEVDLEANPSYWGGRPKLDRVVYSVVTDAAARFQKYQAGDVDVINLSRDDVYEALKRPKMKAELHYIDAPSVTHLVLGERAFAPFRDPHVRLAFLRAIDREKLVREYLPGTKIMTGLVPAGIPGFPTPGAVPAYDPAAARAELAAAGYPGGRGFPEIEFDYSDFFPDWRKVAESTAFDLENNLGIKVKPRQLAWATLLDRLNVGKVPFGISGWQADYLDAQNFLSISLATGAPENREGFSDPEFDALCAQADRGGTPETRVALYQKAERRALELGARIPLYMISYPTLIAPRVKGIQFGAMGTLPLQKVEIVGG